MAAKPALAPYSCTMTGLLCLLLSCQSCHRAEAECGCENLHLSPQSEASPGYSGNNQPESSHISPRCSNISQHNSGKSKHQQLSSTSRVRETLYSCERKWRSVERMIVTLGLKKKSALHFIQNPFSCSLHWHWVAGA